VKIRVRKAAKDAVLGAKKESGFRGRQQYARRPINFQAIAAPVPGPTPAITDVSGRNEFIWRIKNDS
jgi:hypothetical protein